MILGLCFVALPSLIIVGLILIPYLDNNPKGNGYYTFKERKFAVSVFFLATSIGMSWYILALHSEGLSGHFSGLGEKWTHDFPTPPPLHNMPLPLGIILMMGFYFAGLVLPAMMNRDFFNKLGIVRYVLTMGLLLSMIGTVIKMVFTAFF